MTEQRIWFDTKQAADRAGNHRDTVEKALAAGTLHGYQRTTPRGRWRIHVDCLDAWCAGEPCGHQAPRLGSVAHMNAGARAS